MGCSYVTSSGLTCYAPIPVPTLFQKRSDYDEKKKKKVGSIVDYKKFAITPFSNIPLSLITNTLINKQVLVTLKLIFRNFIAMYLSAT